MAPRAAASSSVAVPFDSDRLAGQRLAVAAAVALGLHLFLILGIGLRLPDPVPPRAPRALEVMLVTNPGATPERADPNAVAAQVDRVGETLRAVPDLPQPTTETIATPREPAQPGPPAAESADVLVPVPLRSEPAPEPAPIPEPVPIPEPPEQRSASPQLTARSGLDEPLPRPVHPIVSAADILASRNAEIAALSARLNAATSAYASRARRRTVSASTREFRYATYMESWRRKVERIGNLNYPEAAKEQGLFGNLILNVAVRSDGSLESVRVLRSSGHPLLDDAAMKIVELSAPFAPFPPDIAAETDVLDITRTWQFQRNNQLGWGK